MVPTFPKPPLFLQITASDQVVVASMCSDGMKLADQLGHQWTLHEQVCGHQHTHLVGNAGGPISIAPEPEMVSAFPHRFVGPYTKSAHDLEEIEIGCYAMRTNCIELVGHVPCRLAQIAGLDIFQVMRSTLNAAPLVIDHVTNSELVKPITEACGLKVRVDCYLHAHQLTQFKTRAINPVKFWEHHDEFEALAQRYRTHGVPMAVNQ
ncbi:MAG: hypothetical protein JNK33_03870 [Candidatus Doudnabacteria bacterium]|nr:hypothetical protein [Candidatus Doudnabacteria bacterium]